MPNPTGKLGNAPPGPATADELVGRQRAARSIGLIPSFDGLRAVAVTVIVVYHLRSFVPGWNRYMVGGFLGVDIFFVLSGFLVTAVLLREHERTGRIRLWVFYRGRVLRLVPALLALILVEFLWATAIHIAMSFEVPAVLEAVTGLSLWGLHIPILETHVLFGPNIGMAQLWSLVVEEQFYIVWPVVLIAVLALARRLRGAAVVTTLALIVVLALHRAVMESRGELWLALYARSDYRADALLWGALGALLWVNGWLPRRGLEASAWVGSAIVCVCIFVARIDSPWLYVWGLPLVAVSSLLVVLALVETDWSPKRVLSLRGVCAIGVVSYGLYLWHPLAFAMAQKALGGRPVGLQMASGLALAVVFTLLSWFLVERPSLRLKDRLRGRPSRVAPQDRAAAPADPLAPVAADPAPVDPGVAGPFDPSQTPD